MRRRAFALVAAAVALGGTGCFRLCERWFGPDCCGCGPGDRRPAPRPGALPPAPGDDRIPPAAVPGAPPALPPVPGGTGVGAYGGTGP